MPHQFFRPFGKEEGSPFLSTPGGFARSCAVHHISCRTYTPFPMYLVRSRQRAVGFLLSRSASGGSRACGRPTAAGGFLNQRFLKI